MAKLGLAFISAILISINSFVAHADEVGYLDWATTMRSWKIVALM